MSDKAYQGWTNSRTWNANWRLEQNEKSYKELVAIRKAGKVTANDVKSIWNKYFSVLTFETWTKGKVNWQEIADFYNDMKF